MILNRSLLKQLLINSTVAIGIVLIIIMTNQVVNQLRFVVSGRLTAFLLLQLLGIEALVFFTFLIPLSGYLAAISVLSRLYTSNELTVMQACGISKKSVFGVVLFFGLGLTLLSMVMSFWISPKVEGLQSRLMLKATMMVATRKVIPRRFNVIDKQGAKVIYVEANHYQTQRLNDVFIAQEPSHSAVQAPQLARWDLIKGTTLHVQQRTGGTPFLLIEKGYRYHFDSEGGLTESRFSEHGMALPVAHSITAPWPQSGNVVALFHALKKHDLKASGELLLRLSVPVSVLILLLMACGLTKIDPRRGKLSFVLPAILIYLFYTNAIFMVQSMVDRNVMTLWVGFSLLHGIPVIVSLFMIFLRHGGRQWIQSVLKK